MYQYLIYGCTTPCNSATTPAHDQGDKLQWLWEMDAARIGLDWCIDCQIIAPLCAATDAGEVLGIPIAICTVSRPQHPLEYPPRSQTARHFVKGFRPYSVNASWRGIDKGGTRPVL